MPCPAEIQFGLVVRSARIACGFLLLITTALPGQVWAEETKTEEGALRVLTAEASPELFLNKHLLQQVAEAESQIKQTAAGLKSEAELKHWQEDLRTNFLNALGELPERTPLNAKVTGTVERDGYTVEKVLFESRPKHFVTGALFLPDPEKFKPPYPGILIPCGHSATGKGIDAYQRGAVLSAVNGMAAFVFDPIDQGERMQRLNEQGKPRLQGTGGHNHTGVSAIPLGWNTATFRVWDGMRALDYLAARPEVDAEQLGCMGNSGGGTLTSFLTALDTRIKSSSPSCYITTLRQVCESIGPQDAEQNIFGQLGFGMDHAEFMLMQAPIPVRLCAAKRDFFPIEGTREAFARIKGVHQQMGFEGRITLVEHDATHGWAEPLRVAAVDWMRFWLRGEDQIEVPSEEDMGIGEQDIVVTDKGQVMHLAGARNVYDLMRDESDRLATTRAESTSRDLRAAVRARAGIRSLKDLPSPKVEILGKIERDWGMIEKMTLEILPGVPLPALRYAPKQAEGSPVLLADGQGKQATAEEAEKLAQQGRMVLAIDLTAMGELEGSGKRFYGSSIKDESDAMIAYLLGKSLVGIRAEDLLAAARYVTSQQEGAESVELIATGWATTPALHAAVAEPELFAKTTLRDRTKTWSEVISQEDRHRFSDLVHGALHDYDLDDLAAAVE
ncbi:MAG: acetylxylan esterase [Pirellulaceae bacterium]